MIVVVLVARWRYIVDGGIKYITVNNHGQIYKQIGVCYHRYISNRGGSIMYY